LTVLACLSLYFLSPELSNPGKLGYNRVMTIRVLIVDPDLGFTVPIKRALEQSGDYAVGVFSSGQAAIEMVQREAQDVAILDFNVEDMDLPGLIGGLRQVQPGLFILASPRTNDHIAQLPNLDIQGSITKPYFARQLVSVIQEAVAARTRLTQKERERRVEAMEPPQAPSVLSAGSSSAKYEYGQGQSSEGR